MSREYLLELFLLHMLIVCERLEHGWDLVLGSPKALLGTLVSHLLGGLVAFSCSVGTNNF